MILKLVLDWLLEFAEWVVNGLPSPDMPSYVTNGAAGISDVLALGWGLCNWIPMEHYRSALIVVSSAYMVNIATRAFMTGLNYFRGAGS